MSDDLISRKALIADMRSRKYIDKALCEIFETIVDDASVAFDKEKVIEELTMGRFITIDGNTVGKSVNIRIDRAVEIVEKGGIE